MTIAPVDVLAAARAVIPQTLVSDRAWDTILPLAALQPSVPCIQFLEIRLDSNDARVDYQIIGRLPQSASLVERASRVTRKRGGRPPRGTDAFAVLLREDRALKALVPFLGLEYDLPEEQAASPPQVGFCVYPRFFGNEEARAAPSPSSRAFYGPVKRALDALRAEPLSAQTEATLRRCLAGLPPRATLMHVAALVGRAGDVRLVPQLPAREVPAYLKRVGWVGEVGQVKDAVSACKTEGSLIKIDVDLGGHVMPKFAAFAEYSASRAMASRQTYAMTGPLIDRLIERGLCDRRKGKALTRWPSRIAAAFGRRGAPAVLLLHLDFKIVVSASGQLQAKAYLGILPHVLTADPV
jgi:hypothetical protein